MKMKRSKFEASELLVLGNVRNTLLLMREDPDCPRMWVEQLTAQIHLLRGIVKAHGAYEVDASTITSKTGVVHEWPNTSKERIRAAR